MFQVPIYSPKLCQVFSGVFTQRFVSSLFQHYFVLLTSCHRRSSVRLLDIFASSVSRLSGRCVIEDRIRIVLLSHFTSHRRLEYNEHRHCDYFRHLSPRTQRNSCWNIKWGSCSFFSLFSFQPFDQNPVPVLAPFLSGVVTSYASWRAMHVILFLMSSLSFIFSIALPETSHPGSRGIDKSFSDASSNHHGIKFSQFVRLNPFKSLALLRIPSILLWVNALLYHSDYLLKRLYQALSLTFAWITGIGRREQYFIYPFIFDNELQQCGIPWL